LEEFGRNVAVELYGGVKQWMECKVENRINGSFHEGTQNREK
jgi:hypothetical protein